MYLKKRISSLIALNSPSFLLLEVMLALMRSEAFHLTTGEGSGGLMK